MRHRSPEGGAPQRAARAVHLNGAFRVLATRDVAPGEVALVIDGSRVERPSRHSMQLGEDLHVEVVGDLATAVLLERHPWRFTNHSCDPNTRLVGTTLVAVRLVHSGEEITFNYNTTEWELAEPFVCACGSAQCAGTIRGFRHLEAPERERIRELLAGHLLQRHGRGRAAHSGEPA